MAKNASVRGLFLWSVSLTGDAVSLWVTTKRRSLMKATAKAEKTLKRAIKTGEARREAVIQSVECHGTIDA